jgi:nucleoside 2-deoxyribosyltransferase
MLEIKAPNEPIIGTLTLLETRIFLAGSIEMGVAEMWQDRIARDLSHEDVVIFNPRRDDWDSSWEQKASNPQFAEQVNWELDHIDTADIVIFYFDPGTKSPVTLMELGYVIGQGCAVEIIVCCPDGFWRKGNVEIMCDRNNITLVNTYEELVEEIRDYL